MDDETPRAAVYAGEGRGYDPQDGIAVRGGRFETGRDLGAVEVERNALTDSISNLAMEVEHLLSRLVPVSTPTPEEADYRDGFRDPEGPMSVPETAVSDVAEWFRSARKAVEVNARLLRAARERLEL